MQGSAGMGVAVGLIVAVTLSGCGGSSDSSASDSLKVVAAAAGATTAQHTARTSFVAEGTSDGKPYSVRSQGTIDFRSRDFEEITTSSEPVLSGEMRVIDGVSYLKSALQAIATPGSALLAGKPWSKDSSDSGDKLVDDPAALLEKLRAVTDAQKLGTEPRRGVSTTRYRLTLNAAKERQMAKSTPTQKLDQKDPTIEVWIDDAGRLRQLRIAGRDKSGSGSVTSEFYDFGVPVDIEPPPADQVFDLDSP